MENAPELPKQHSIFVSYSSQDTAFAQRVQADLVAHGISAWVDQIGITPGTPDWDEALRSAIKQAQALVLLASPHSRLSSYVRGELEVARAYGCRVYPFWVWGDHWIEAIPLGWSSVQHIDARGEQYETGIHKLIAALTDLLRLSVTPTRVTAQSGPGDSSSDQATQQAAPPLTSPASSPALPQAQGHDPNMIDLAITAARMLGADQHPVALSVLHTAYLKANPDITKGRTLNSFSATINYHTINMRSRFFYPNNKRKPAEWVTRPVFKRVAYGQYMLLSDDDLRLFRQRVAEDDPRIYQDEYNINDLL